MRVTVITPSYNQGMFLNNNFTSIINQTYQDIEHLIYDALSTDNSSEIISQYLKLNPKAQATIEADGGQCQAINKGFDEATGDIICWLNSDDSYYDSDTIATIVDAFKNSDADILYGRGTFIDEDGQKIKEVYVNRNIHGSEDFIKSLGIFQPALFFRRDVLDKVGGLDPNYQLNPDYELWIRIIKAGFKFEFIDKHFAKAVLHDQSKTCGSRTNQLIETMYLLKKHYGYVHNIWYERLYEHVALDQDWTSISNNKGAENIERSQFDDSQFKSLNLLGLELFPKAEINKKNIRYNPEGANISRIIVTSFDSAYFNQGLTLLASIHANAENEFDLIVIYSLGLQDIEKEHLEMLEGVICVDYPAEEPWEGYYHPKSYMYKCYAIFHAKSFITQNEGMVLWIDSGVSVEKLLGPTWKVIEEESAFLINHDDRDIDILNINCTHPSQMEALQLTERELYCEQICSCILGYRLGSKGEELINRAYELSLIQDINDHTKHPHNKWVPPVTQEQRKGARKFIDQEGDAVFVDHAVSPYFGHRQDQSLFSNIASQMHLAVQSATKWCPASDYSSIASLENWKSGGEAEHIEKVDNPPPEIDTPFFHHRGTVLNTIGLKYDRSQNMSSTMAFVLGNGPSLKDVDFESLKGIATIGMNAAYRYWHEHHWYPTYYCCMDTVVILSHAEAIYGLIQERVKNGIQYFFLRRAILDIYPDLEKISEVLFQEDLEKQNPLFRVGPITTGSYSMLFLIHLGFRKIILAGVDCNYVEIIKGASKTENNELIIDQNIEDNPNYFFATYQQKGDSYNIPNPNPGLHERAWKHAYEALKANCSRVNDFEIMNTNSQSQVSYFPHIDIEDIQTELSGEFNKLFDRIENAYPYPIFDYDSEHYGHMANKAIRSWYRPQKKTQNDAIKVEFKNLPTFFNQTIFELKEAVLLSRQEEVYISAILEIPSDVQNFTFRVLSHTLWAYKSIVHFQRDEFNDFQTSDPQLATCMKSHDKLYHIYFRGRAMKDVEFPGIRISKTDKIVIKSIGLILTKYEGDISPRPFRFSFLFLREKFRRRFGLV